ncbi:MAG: hypothetical protein IJV44_09175 [Prevotella sp.]|nr:hypothetical protein [Prevotella sp.]
MRKVILLPFYLFSLLLLTSCGAENEYTSWPCRFIYDNSIHLDQTLAVAINPVVHGIFCMITEESRGGSKYLIFENNQGASSRQIETAEELRNNLRLGLNNGIIVGVQNLGDYSFTAYDVQCPNCVRRENNMASPNYRMILDKKGSGIVTCSKCGNKYDLNNKGLLIEGQEGDKGLSQYRNAHTAGPNGVVTVFSE